MTDDEIDALTLGDVRRIVARATEAAKSLTELRTLFGPVVAPASAQAPAAQLVPGQALPERPPTAPQHEAYLATIRGEREALVAKNRGPPPKPDDFPPDIADAMRAT